MCRNTRGKFLCQGGSCESKDASLIATALREAFEEVGVPCRDVDVLGLLDDSITISSNFVITPVVGFLPYQPEIVINPGEVEEAMEIPLSFFQGAVEGRRWGAIMVPRQNIRNFCTATIVSGVRLP